MLLLSSSPPSSSSSSLLLLMLLLLLFLLLLLPLLLSLWFLGPGPTSRAPSNASSSATSERVKLRAHDVDERFSLHIGQFELATEVNVLLGEVSE